jgi:hypothetical protein
MAAHEEEEYIDEEFSEEADEEYDEDDDIEEEDEEDYEGEEDALPPAMLQMLQAQRQQQMQQQRQQQQPSQQQPAEQPAPKPWTSLSNHPAATQQTFQRLLKQMQDHGLKRVGILTLGKTGAGKSSLANSLFADNILTVDPFVNAARIGLTSIRRAAAGFELQYLDTPGLSDGDGVQHIALQAIIRELKVNPVNVVLWVDRLDLNRVEDSDRQLMQAVTQAAGASIWDNAIICLTHAARRPPKDTSYEDYVQARGASIRSALRKAGADRDAELPVALVENSLQRCQKNDDNEPILTNGTRWLPSLMEQVAHIATTRKPFRYNQKAVARQAPDRKLLWAIPLLLAAQWALKVFVFDRLVEEDGVTRDQYGEYDKDMADRERARLRQRKEQQRRERQAAKQRAARKAAKAKDTALTKAKQAVDDDDDEDDDYLTDDDF